MNAGDAFTLAVTDATPDTHFWMVISDPSMNPDRVLIVNLTTWREDKEQGCILSKGDHPWIRHKSCVNYREARVVSLAELSTLLTSGLLTMETALSSSVLKRVRQGAADSMLIALGKAEILIEQGLIDA